MIDGSVLQTVQRCFEKKSRVVVKMVVNIMYPHFLELRKVQENVVCALIVDIFLFCLLDFSLKV